SPTVEELILDTPAGAVPARLEGEGSWGILLATGAGTGHDHPGVAGLRSRLAAAATVMTFEYAYRAEGRRFPDSQPKLLSVHRAAAARLRERVGPRLVLAGRSMGGRMSTILASQGEECAGVVAYGYPLHPPGKPDRLRVDHLGDVRVPILFLTGTRDALARSDLVDRYLAILPTARLVRIDGADHSFRRKGTAPGEMLDHLVAETVAWLDGLEKRERS
ncbi:MAG: alpha/beta family hydrolase, partial [Actinomycetota bacterium]